ncbi:uncharacterized protein KGF55_000001 [Candida pseudojiufengensis]|uniref:uncharacterized protein n=1 Tax=Candida pseudojiufengensis TaxID=497109 RepID=UPI0022246EE8|nr:uncharacterized protein KGF55_000001 [Candida pseudojiufengensis]KAI5968172.1 hypothetical protein KGF55_000001 [Candida pseudojiufengensis]
MSENLKRAESLFNRIMNQGSDSPTLNSSPQQQSQSQAQQNQHHQNSNYSHRSKHRNGDSHHHNNNNHRNHHNNNYHNNSSNNNNNNTSHINHNISSLEIAKLPKLDVLKLTQEALDTIGENEHVLPYCWTIWHHSRTKKQIPPSQPSPQQPSTDEESNQSQQSLQQQQQQQPGVDSYLQTTSQLHFQHTNELTISHIASIEQMWTMFSTIKNGYKLSIGTEFLIFKTGINPVWEDPLNSKGGRWVFRFNRKNEPHSFNNNNNSIGSPNLELQSSHQSIEKLRKRSSLIWERLVLKILTGNFIPSNSNEIKKILLNDICGIVLSVRKDEDIISIWNSNLNFIKSSTNSSSTTTNKKLTSFQARRIICDSILRIIRECDEILNTNSNCITTLDSGSNERVYGVSFEYRLHVETPINHDNSSTNNSNNTNGNGNDNRLNSKNNDNNSRKNGRYSNKNYHHQYNNKNDNTNNNEQSIKTISTETN